MAFAHTTRFIVIVVTLVAAGMFVSTLFSSIWYAPVGGNDITINNSLSATPAENSSSLPARIIIPKIAVDATLEHVGLGKSGNMAVPLQYSNAGWYRYGPKPGEVGSAVIDGHVDNGLGNSAVFGRLTELSVGDDIYIERDDGTRVHFKVVEQATYALADAPRELIFNRKDAARLNLITCDGTWLPEEKMYDKRHVVYAVLAS
jgi:sortase (surface protein transpeptidase)